MPKSSGSLKKTSLSSVEQFELNQWLRDNHVFVSNLRRSFTDVLPLARLMSRYYPGLIDLNYYPPRNSVQNKLCNWESFNRRVLARLNLNLTREQMVRVARSEPGSVDLLLYSVMRMAERQARLSRDKDETDQDEEEVKTETEAVAPNAVPKPVNESKPAIVPPQTLIANATETVASKAVSIMKVPSSVAKNQKSNRGTTAAGRNKKQQGGGKEPGTSSRLKGRQTPAASKRR